jgi:hypothetical protein
MNNQRTPMTFGPIRLLLALPLALPLACSGSNNDDAGLPVMAQEYFNFAPGQCFEYTTGDAGTPTRGLLVQPVVSPPGEVSVKTLKRGQIEQIEYLTFDAGVAYLNQRDVYPSSGSDGGIDSRLFTTPLTYLVAPLTQMQPNFTSSSDYTGSSVGSENFTVGLNGTPFLWNGFGADAGGSTAYPMQFSDEPDGGGGLTQNRTMLPLTGFVQLTATDDNGMFVTFTLVGIHAFDGGFVCGN